MESDTSVVPVILEHSQRIADLETQIGELLKERTSVTISRAEREKIRYNTKRAEINAKRRAAYKAKKEAAAATGL